MKCVTAGNVTHFGENINRRPVIAASRFGKTVLYGSRVGQTEAGFAPSVPGLVSTLQEGADHED